LPAAQSCSRPVKKEEQKAPQETGSPIAEELRKMHSPILPIKKDYFWKYKVRVEIQPGVASESVVAVEIDKTRTFLGKVKISKDRTPVEAFDVVVPGQPVERGLVVIQEDRVMILGAYYLEQPDARLAWLKPAIPSMVAEIRPGQQMVLLTVRDGSGKRGIKIVARKSIEVPAGEYY